MKRSGCSEEEEVGFAVSIFDKNKFSYPRDDIGRPFRFMNFWKMFLVLPNFHAASSPSTLNTLDNI